MLDTLRDDWDKVLDSEIAFSDFSPNLWDRNVWLEWLKYASK
jgi:hypothetical protein